MTLAGLIRKGGIAQVATATPATFATHGASERATVATVATVAVANPEIPGPDLGLKVAIAEACTGLSIKPADAMAALSPEDIEDWHAGGFGSDGLRAFVVALDLRRRMERGEKPSHYTEPATCRHCGPVWLWRRGEVMGCPWCWNRRAGRPIPRPVPLPCGDCRHFRRIDHPHLGHCAKGEPEAAAGLWDTDDRSHCAAFRASGPRITPQTDGEAL